MKIPVIPLDNLNCYHCGLYKRGRCSLTGERVKRPDKHYCLQIFQYYRKGLKDESKKQLYKSN